MKKECQKISDDFMEIWERVHLAHTMDSVGESTEAEVYLKWAAQRMQEAALKDILTDEEASELNGMVKDIWSSLKERTPGRGRMLANLGDKVEELFLNKIISCECPKAGASIEVL